MTGRCPFCEVDVDGDQELAEHVVDDCRETAELGRIDRLLIAYNYGGYSGNS